MEGALNIYLEYHDDHRLLIILKLKRLYIVTLLNFFRGLFIDGTQYSFDCILHSLFMVTVTQIAGFELFSEQSTISFAASIISLFYIAKQTRGVSTKKR
jgi:hypothetical protein